MGTPLWQLLAVSFHTVIVRSTAECSDELFLSRLQELSLLTQFYFWFYFLGHEGGINWDKGANICLLKGRKHWPIFLTPKKQYQVLKIFSKRGITPTPQGWWETQIWLCLGTVLNFKFCINARNYWYHLITLIPSSETGETVLPSDFCANCI